jgi:hypothetical protein
MLVTPAGNVKVVNPVQSWNAFAPMLVTLLLANEIVVKEALLHPLNALAPMLVILFGIVMVVNPVHP